jgi:hypothetical protein
MYVLYTGAKKNAMPALKSSSINFAESWMSLSKKEVKIEKMELVLCLNQCYSGLQTKCMQMRKYDGKCDCCRRRCCRDDGGYCCSPEPPQSGAFGEK